MKILILIVLICIFSPVLTQSLTPPKDIIRIGCLYTNSPFAPVVEKILTDRGYTVDVKVYPAERSWQMVNKGELAIDFFRTADIIDSSNELIRVDISLVETEYFAYTADKNLVIDSFDDFKKLKVGYPRGLKVLKEIFKDFDAYEGVDFTKMTQMVETGRIDVVISTPVAISYVKKNRPTLDLYQQLPIAKVNAYLALNKNRADLKKPLEEIFQKLVDSGEWDNEVKKIVGITP